MKLDSLSKECVIIGSFTLVLSLVLIPIEIEELTTILKSEYSQDNRSGIIKEHYHKIVAYLAAALISVLLILGIRKRRAIFMAPWLLAAFAGVAVSSYFIIGNLIFLPFGQLEFLMYSTAVIGLEIIILYPLCTLCNEIRLERSNKVSRPNQIQDTFTVKI